MAKPSIPQDATSDRALLEHWFADRSRGALLPGIHFERTAISICLAIYILWYHWPADWRTVLHHPSYTFTPVIAGYYLLSCARLLAEEDRQHCPGLRLLGHPARIADFLLNIQ